MGLQGNRQLDVGKEEIYKCGLGYSKESRIEIKQGGGREKRIKQG